ncbi:lanthionine synthetase C family protein [Actinacidiphila sp. ITFR-21]|uniref:lanthionine synthetase C family protein n=1 Tax=Actinacidiphila sp. ITFR-21 TaxID=3075199 RepID=UPI00288AEA99|nr:lanthionine synthetase C family protein [Streptomyces sp. ITFR-21]WNI17644.1 lanthionine synthetase C family protein [Streptomyces sp. ITFR-21]WNI17784.1 lanthionine synthetase C family protein [Streptomyces sp. ITFR-21]
MSDVTHDLGRGLPGSVVYEAALARVSGRWDAAHRAARTVASQPAAGRHESAGLFYGAPAVAFALHTAGHPAYQSALGHLDEALTDLVAARLSAADQRMETGRPARMREYDLISGLTGLGAYFLHRGSSPESLHGVLRYLVRLLQHPLNVDGHLLPGWWTSDSPTTRPEDAVPAGHGNFGMAHGIAGPIALLALAGRAGHTVRGQFEALAASCRLLEKWAQPVPGGGAAWPEVVDRETWLTGPEPRFRAGRPSWCYGTPGIARALQLAALACGLDGTRRRAEALLDACLRDSDQLARVTDSSVCHGWAGLSLAADLAAADADADSPLRRTLPSLAARLEQVPMPEGTGLLTGSDGVRLTIHTLTPPRPVASGWETCLLLN